MKNSKTAALYLVAALGFGVSGAYSQSGNNSLPMDRVYQGHIQLPDFAGRDSQFRTFRTRISNEMRTGPNFAGHYAIVDIGCGTGCHIVFVGDVATGKMFPFPYGGEDYNMLGLRYAVKSNYVTARWEHGGSCYRESLDWNGSQFSTSVPREIIGPDTECNK
ncbi:hypothetical protein LMG24235_08621 [Paraburkholderia sabiae]|nr:hypothetical protein LMG24235_08621 [Paraburkholderia sabiae]